MKNLHKNSLDKFLKEDLNGDIELVKQALLANKMDLGVKQIDSSNYKQFAQWVLRDFKRKNTSMFTKYFHEFQKAGIIDSFSA